MSVHFTQLEHVILPPCDETSLLELIAKAQLDYVNPDIVAHFETSYQRQNELTCAALKFETTLASEEVISALKEHGFSAANIFELVAFSVQMPNFQRTTPVIALGSSWRHKKNDSLVPALWGGPLSRELNICSWSTHWFVGDVFLGTRP